MRTAPMQTGASLCCWASRPILAPIESSLAQDVRGIPRQKPRPSSPRSTANQSTSPRSTRSWRRHEGQNTNKCRCKTRAMSFDRSSIARWPRKPSSATAATSPRPKSTRRSTPSKPRQRIKTNPRRVRRPQGATMDTIRHELMWQIAWPRYLERHLTDGLEAYFNSHRHDFDGTEVRASHILLRPERAGDTAEMRVDRARKIRKDIEQGKLTFEQAVEQYSAGPSRKAAGDLGFFPRYGVMFEEFSKAAFALDKGQISEPVVSTLWRPPDPGHRHQARQQAMDRSRRSDPAGCRRAVQATGQDEADNAKIEYTGTVPYYKPGTSEIVMPPGWKPSHAPAAAPAAIRLLVGQQILQPPADRSVRGSARPRPPLRPVPACPTATDTTPILWPPRRTTVGRQFVRQRPCHTGPSSAASPSGKHSQNVLEPAPGPLAPGRSRPTCDARPGNRCNRRAASDTRRAPRPARRLRSSCGLPPVVCPVRRRRG